MDRAQATQETSLADVLNSPLPTWPYVYCTPIVESYQYHFGSSSETVRWLIFLSFSSL